MQVLFRMENSFSFKLLNESICCVPCKAISLLCYILLISHLTLKSRTQTKKYKHAHTHTHPYTHLHIHTYTHIHKMWNEFELKLPFNVSMYAVLSKPHKLYCKICVNASSTIAKKVVLACLQILKNFNFTPWINEVVLIIISTHTHTHTNISLYMYSQRVSSLAQVEWRSDVEQAKACVVFFL